jgi:hypothetical protein
MNKKTIKQIADNLRAISSKVISPNASINLRFAMHDEIAYGLPADAVREFNDQVKIILKNNEFSNRFSEKYISEELKKIFALVIKNKAENLEKEISDFINRLYTFQHEITIYLQVTGLKVEQPLRVGNVNFLWADKKFVDNLKSKLQSVTTTLKNDAKSKVIIFGQISSNIDEELLGKTISEYTINAEPIRAYERAKEETIKAIDLFHFASKSIYPISENIKIGLKGEFLYSRRQAFLFSEKRFYTTGDWVGPVETFLINENTLKRLKNIGFTKLSDFLKKKQPSQYEAKLLESVHWFSSAIKQEEIENSFLLMIIALESLFTKEQGSPRGNQIAEATALILGKNLEQKKEIKSLIIKYYGFRSAISHGGKKRITEGDYFSLLNIVGSVTAALIDMNEKFQSQKELLNWIEDLKLSP